jgi:hypothetical protein
VRAAGNFLLKDKGAKKPYGSESHRLRSRGELRAPGQVLHHVGSVFIIIIIIIRKIIAIVMIINMLMPVKQNSFTRLSILLVLTDRGILALSY